MVSVDRVYQTVAMLLNTDGRGNVTPRERRLAIYDSVNEIYENYFAEINRLLNRQNRGLMGGGLENMPDRFMEKLQHFLIEDTVLVYSAPYWLLPADHRFTDVVTCDGKEVEFYKNNREFKIVSNYADTAPTATYPIGLKMGETIKIAPSTAESVVNITYLRNQVMPNWTYTVINNTEVFNPDAIDFKDIDLHASEENNVVIKTLFRFGVNLKEQDVVAITQNKSIQEFNQDNTV